MKHQEDPNHKAKDRVKLDLAHRLLELADAHSVHIPVGFRRELMSFQDRVIQAMNDRLDREVRK